MPNGGQHYERLGVCPLCGSPNIRIRRRRHRNLLWRCRTCNRVFRSPRVGEYAIPPGHDGSGYVHADSIPRMERRGRLRGPRGSRLLPRSFSRKAVPVAVLVLLLGVVGYLAFTGLARNGDGIGQRLSALVPDATVTPTSTPVPPPPLRHIEEKRYMLQLINDERVNAGLDPVVLGDNAAAQLQAEAALANCFGGHWGIDGLKPYMRYSLAGGYQSNSENGSGGNYCRTASHGYAANGSPEQEIEVAMYGREGNGGLMNSPDHRDNILVPSHKKVNIGLAWDRYTFKVYQHFEGDYVEYDQLPIINKGILRMGGATKNGARFDDGVDSGVQVYYDPPPHPLTVGQVSRTYCYALGEMVAGLRPPLSGGWSYTDDEFTQSSSPCPDPYDVPADAEAPRSADEDHEIFNAAYGASQSKQSQPITVPWITALEWTARDEDFSVAADLSAVLAKHGKGVYSIVVWGSIDGENVVISEYSIFHEMTPPDTYGANDFDGG